MKAISTDTQELHLKQIQELLEKNFFIPSYQRGYRWREQQVEDLLTDISYFGNTVRPALEGEDPPFYCLQPICVKRRPDGSYEVIDGQQRLTSILILLHYFNAEEFKRPKPVYTLRYETRPGSGEYLENITEEQSGENIDYFHIYRAKGCIEKWFKQEERKDVDIRGKFYRTLVTATRVIWYEVLPTASSIDIFTRLNIGKIPLTNAELIKALFLRRDNFGSGAVTLQQVKIAQEWDQIENRLQTNDFWYFIYDSSSTTLRYPNTRIEYLFDLMQNKGAQKAAYYTFHKFSEEFALQKSKQGSLGVEGLWLRVKQFFQTFEEWYRDRELYHLVGYLIAIGDTAANLKGLSENQTKSAFKAALRHRIRDKVDCDLNELEYTNNKPLIRKILLLFNIETLLRTKNSHLRFPFDRYKAEAWDIEHVRSQAEKVAQGRDRFAYLRDVLWYLSGEQNSEHQLLKIKELGQNERGLFEQGWKLLNEQTNPAQDFQEKFTNYTEAVAEYFGEATVPENIHGLANLALLDASTNRGYKNAPFPIKRQTISDNDRRGVFIPIGTKNLFMKLYNNRVRDITHWTEDDARNYMRALQDTLQPYLSTPQTSIHV